MFPLTSHRRRGVTLSLSTAVVVLLNTLPVTAADLRIKEVVLYKHGVGYFERSAALDAGESAILNFKASDMNDVLKSLTVVEKGGAVSALRYEANDTLARRLEAFPFRIGERQPLAALLDQMRGARISLSMGATSVTGAVVGARLAATSDKQPDREWLTLLTAEGELRQFDLATVSSLRFTDAALQVQFQEYLATVLNARGVDRRRIIIESVGNSRRDISAAYMLPMPAWKSSYRLMFSTDTKPMLEGWAIVDNTTDEDWSQVKLSLVSGRPISFVSRLYEPRHVARPSAELPDEVAQGPAVFSSAIASGAGVRGAVAAPAKPAAAASPGVLQRGLAVADSRLEVRETSTIAEAAAARNVGELFEYRIPRPVTVRKNESAMLPFLQQRLAARKLLIYANQNSPHPVNAAELSNDTGKTLDGGPVTVYDGGGYAGEALMETLKEGDKRLISYGVDLGTRLTTRFDSGGETIREIRARDGVLTLSTVQRETRTYAMTNVDAREKTLIIEHPARSGYNLVERKPVERTASAYRFEVKLAPKSDQSFPVIEERVLQSTVVLASLSADDIVVYSRNRALSDGARKQLEAVGRARAAVSAIEENIRSTDNQVREVAADQDRVRRNIASLNSVAGQQGEVQRYARQLAEQEAQIVRLRDQRADLDRQLRDANQQLRAQLANLNF